MAAVLSNPFATFDSNYISYVIIPSMAREGVDASPPPSPTDFSSFSQKWEDLFLQTKFLPIGSSLEHLSMKKFFKSDLPLGSRIRQREGAGGVGVATTPF